MQTDFSSHTSSELLAWIYQDTFLPYYLFTSWYLRVFWLKQGLAEEKQLQQDFRSDQQQYQQYHAICGSKAAAEPECSSINRQLFEDLPVLKGCLQVQLPFVLKLLNHSL